MSEEFMSPFDKADDRIDTILLQNGVPFRVIRDIRFFSWLNSFVKPPKALVKDDLSINNSLYFNQFDNVYPVNEIPQISIYDDDDRCPSKMYSIFHYFCDFKFGSIPFTCTHELDPMYGIFPGNPTVQDKDIFEIHYGIKLKGVYISLSELADVASSSGIFSQIDDFFVVGNYDNTVLTIIDNDLDYSAHESTEEYKCNFKPIFALDRGIPVKYIKTIDDKEPFSFRRFPERNFEYHLQRKQHLKKLNDIFNKDTYQQDDYIRGYPSEVDFIIKTGLHQFALLSYDRFSKSNDFWITHVCYNNDRTDPKYVIQKCNFWNLQQNIKSIQCARANHFNKMYGPMKLNHIYPCR